MIVCLYFSNLQKCFDIQCRFMVIIEHIAVSIYNKHIPNGFVAIGNDTYHIQLTFYCYVSFEIRVSFMQIVVLYLYFYAYSYSVLLDQSILNIFNFKQRIFA